MEIEGQWRREWAGAAEYGKVIEGGITRRVARAMEVVHASGPGSRVRVMRAAYHSTAGPGVPASSYMLHSSRRVISSGSNHLESPSAPTKPFEISSIPFESLQDNNNVETENYKVTEPDDFEISEPSKWKPSNNRTSMRMPSEESSSTDNASIIDVDARTHKNLLRKCSYDSETSDVQTNKKSSARTSPLLDTSAALSTLKYKSLLNGSSDWNNRRKSYSFEDTPPLSDHISQYNTLGMESSTDSGICKSTEIVNEYVDETRAKQFNEQEESEETFKDWLLRNRSSSYQKSAKDYFKPHKDHSTVVEDDTENNIALQSLGKVSITLPVTLETEEEYRHRKSLAFDDGDRRIKRVEFCKTELHFAADSGKVNIIATDEKPPPSNDFRKRRSAFVPIRSKFEKPVTLFGEKKIDFSESINDSIFSSEVNSVCDGYEIDENTAATKSILKNKIPKPKPYLLGENMAFGKLDSIINDRSSVLSAVSLINKQLHSQRRYSTETASSYTSDIDGNEKETTNEGPSSRDITSKSAEIFSKQSLFIENKDKLSSVQRKTLQMSPIQPRAKTRQLRDTDLMYFGINNNTQKLKENKPKKIENKLINGNESIDDIFNSVRLIQQISNSVCNSEAESDDTAEYQNIPVKVNFTPIPTPRSRKMYDEKHGNLNQVNILKPIIEQDAETVMQDSRRSRVRKYEDTLGTSRSRSEPPKSNRNRVIEKPARQRYQLVNENDGNEKTSQHKSQTHHSIKQETYSHLLDNEEKNIEEESPYVNLSIKEEIVKQPQLKNREESNKKITPKPKNNEDSFKKSYKHSGERHKTTNQRLSSENIRGSLRNKPRLDKEVESEELVLVPTKIKDSSVKRDSSDRKKSYDVKKTQSQDQNVSEKIKQERRSRSTRRHPTNIPENESLVKQTKSPTIRESEKTQNVIYEKENDIKKRNRSSSKDTTNTKKDNTKVTSKYDSLSSDRQINSTGSKSKDRNGTVSASKSENHKNSKRSEYVINYDDKNGTVSSICKVRNGHITPKRKKSSNENTKDIGHPKLKSKNPEKHVLLQPQDRQWKQNGLNKTYKKWKTTMHEQRTCQLL